MNKPTIDELMKHVDSKYVLVVLAAKRARALLSDPERAKEKNFKPVTEALEEIAAGKLAYERTKIGIK